MNLNILIKTIQKYTNLQIYILKNRLSAKFIKIEKKINIKNK